ncbi:MAG: hypothetical protein JHC87_07985, partial [Thermoleophilaceae bacterium]|nr:hypothetical protein [Thermoleophilaceae bacterium]
RWDGNGYPDQLSGEQIPIYSRIVLVCDAYHAMTSDRPYREAMGESYARTELLRYAGTQFDPDVVDCLLQELEERQIAAHDDRVVAAQHLQSAYDRALARTVGPLDNNQNVSAVVHDEGTFTETPVSL